MTTSYQLTAGVVLHTELVRTCQCAHANSQTPKMPLIHSIEYPGT